MVFMAVPLGVLEHRPQANLTHSQCETGFDAEHQLPLDTLPEG